MSAHSLIMALMGGALIGLACVLLLLALGRNLTGMYWVRKVSLTATLGED